MLLVDDDPDFRETMCDILKEEGLPVVAAADGSAALAFLVGGGRPSLILLDLMMPSMNGWELLAVIRAQRSFAATPVVVITAAGDGLPPRGATQLLRKPIDLSALVDLVRNLTAGSPPIGRGRSQTWSLGALGRHDDVEV